MPAPAPTVEGSVVARSERAPAEGQLRLGRAELALGVV
jgi:hypothetical protein